MRNLPGEAPDPEAVAAYYDDGMRSRRRLEEYLGNPRVRIRLLSVY